MKAHSHATQGTQHFQALGRPQFSQNAEETMSEGNEWN
jgi:hypothetical protein